MTRLSIDLPGLGILGCSPVEPQEAESRLQWVVHLVQVEWG